MVPNDLSQIPSIISSLFIRNDNEVREIIESAIKLRNNTPYSLRIFSEHLGIFSLKKFDKLKYLNQYFQPEKMITLPIFASEVFYITFNYLVNCPDESCINFQKSMERLNSSFPKKSENMYSSEKSEVIDLDQDQENKLEISLIINNIRVQLFFL